MFIAILVLVGLFAVAAVAIFMVRSARIKGSMKTQRGACQKCRANGPVVKVHYRQNTGMLVARRASYVEGVLCRQCSLGYGAKMTLHNFVLGWWGYISLVVTPFFIAANLFHIGNSLALPSSDADASARLEVQRAYALNLLATKDEATVVDVLSKLTGVPEPEVRDFVRRLRPAA